MSAYALPGLFPPLPFDSSGVNISISMGDSTFTEKLDISSLDREEKVEHEPHSRRTSSSLDAFSASCCAAATAKPDKISISVKEARIDTIQLIQSLTSCAAPLLRAAKNKRSKRRRNSPPASPEHGPKQPLRIATTKTASGAGGHYHPSSSSNERAMQFEIDISWNGRQYTVVRSLERMREELVAELEMLRLKTSSAFVPELPSLPDSCCCSNQSSFTLLQGLLRSHVPAIETWLCRVFTTVVPHVNDSATLTNFVLEPVCCSSSNGNSPVEFLKLSESLPSLLRRSSLASISEDDEEEKDATD